MPGTYTQVLLHIVFSTKTRERDRKTLTKLRRAEWKVLVVWECQTVDSVALNGRLSRFLSR